MTTLAYQADLPEEGVIMRGESEMIPDMHGTDQIYKIKNISLFKNHL